jgi:hypothetical protein
MLGTTFTSPRIIRPGTLKRSAATPPPVPTMQGQYNIVDLTSSPTQRREIPTEFSPIFVGTTKRAKMKKVVFTAAEPTVHQFDPYNGHGAPDDCSKKSGEGDGGERKSQLTEELTLLSTLHGRARRQIRDISKHDLKTVMKYGTKTRSYKQRWMFEYNNTVLITDDLCEREITSYNKAINIERATITQQMMDNHNEAVRILSEDPHMCTTHSIIIIDQGSSMSLHDVNCFKTRSDASYGTFALDYIAEQLYQMGDEFFVDAVTIIEMRGEGSLFVNKEPLDWILFNKVLGRVSTSRPPCYSDANYFKSLEYAENIINNELALFSDLDADDIPAFMLLFISDANPIDNSYIDENKRCAVVARMAAKLKSKLTFFGMGVGLSVSDFEHLRVLVDTAKGHGAEGDYNHAGLNLATLSTTFSSIATSMTTTRNDLRSTTGERVSKTEKHYIMRQKEKENSFGVPFRREINSVARFEYYPNFQPNYDWKTVPFFNSGSAGFDVEKDPFGKVCDASWDTSALCSYFQAWIFTQIECYIFGIQGAERLAFIFQEIKPKKRGQGWAKVGELLVAKESRYIEDEGSKETFHLHFCRTQRKAQEQAKLFNIAVMNCPLLKPSEDEVSLPPPITFLDCSVYEYINFDGIRCGLLVEKFLRGKFTKFNSNNGFVHNYDPDGASIQLAVGEVLLTDFVQAFSHWAYENTKRKLLVCDLQGIMDMEGFRPAFRLTDPAICSKLRGKRSHYGKTDLGMRGIRNFCTRHICNGVCTALNLPPTMGKYSYKQQK